MPTTLEELENELIRADFGVDVAGRIVETLGAGPLSRKASRPRS